jgi:putative ABC transport system permease protein
MIIRHIGRRPVKSGLTIIGIASSCAIMMSGTFFGDSIDYMVEVQFGLANREDLSVVFVEPASRGALFELKSLEGVEYVEPYRAVPAKLKFGHREYRAAIQGFVERPSLHRALDTNLNPIVMPRGGVLLTDQLGKILGARVGDVITVETLEGARPVRRVPIAGFVGEFVGVSAYMELGALNRLMREGDAISGAYIKTDRAHEDDISERLKDMPRVASATKLKDLVRNVYDTMGEQIRIFTLYIVALSAVIAFGVVYNSARIALAERERELASLRVLGFTRGEISFILLGELGALTLMAIPLGFVIGWGVCAGLIYRLQTDLFRIPLVLEPSTFALAAVVVLLSACVSGYIVKARLDGLDLVSALKTKE